MATTPLAEVEGVDTELTAGCEVFAECTRTAEWLVVWQRRDLGFKMLCEHHRPLFIHLMIEVARLDSSAFDLVRI
ncbi:hypothetical protein Gbro_4893 (plasmid) [Gordonia bronchialis DSM 43247]|uniref:Uncharacterized protein n=1 Tax=Gordonia bronchialis (strain ATCC 25592 / DSM 43247 / BCRC 13721 / JCM 3198 / KCTC 3076 / NBRC 16047 / NCTC 10667) TaxID=526226 RepID=D0LFF7_GORB4|nr:hypothetical protein [Gordonia bronchialis]ACY24006.1 hypothetical protein Gbro_4893 [Gordonia bronchialis DSM 43247]MCC3326022.1 hypothetical protein [Gordonia bronchialis]QGS27330.1 hypothetical protein FOB84_24420 [Gordonia bronchialis]STS10834.1 Uncharacterised protein [Gordonia bronchialis]